VGLTVGLAVLLPTSLLGYLLVPDRDVSESHILLRTLQGKGWEYLVPIALAAALLAPLLEELLFRVVLQGWLADLVGKRAIPLTAGIFALIHGPRDAALLVPLALSLGALYEYRRSYVEVVAAHAAFNAANLFAAVNAG
jgi:membrane protease YdiL (CAAX protease family)